MSCPFPITVVVELLQQDSSLGGWALEIHSPVLQASSHWYMPPNKTLYNTFNIQESQSCVNDTFGHLRKRFRDSTGTYNYYTIKQVSTHIAGFCPICLLAVMSDATTASTWQLDSQLLEHLWVALSLSFGSPYYLSHQTLASDITLAVCASVFSFQCCDEPKT